MDYENLGLDYFAKSEVKKVFPNCHVEFKNCFVAGFEDTPLDYTISADDEQDSNPEGVNDVLDNFDGGEIEFMFTQNTNGEESNKLSRVRCFLLLNKKSNKMLNYLIFMHYFFQKVREPSQPRSKINPRITISNQR